MITIHTLASGSEGNAALVTDGSHHVLVDSGISARRIEIALRSLGISPAELSGIFITHAHTDHIAGLRVFLKHAPMSVFASPATCSQLTAGLGDSASCLCPMACGEVQQLGELLVTAFETSHDAAGSMDYRFDSRGASAGILTDTGYVTENARHALEGVELLVLESNHDVQWLQSGPYPYSLKQRILSDYGHLSNDAAAEFACQMAHCGTKQFVLAHLSRENNTPARASDTVERALKCGGFDAGVCVAPRGECSPGYRVEGTVCRK